MTTTTIDRTDRTYGTRPVGSCKPGTHSWASRHWSTDNYRWEFTTYDAWLIASETKTNDADLATIIDGWMATKYGTES